jgi:serine/threonine protein kinase
MSTLSSIVKSYLDKENVVSLLNSYDDKRLLDPQKKEILKDFYSNDFIPGMQKNFGIHFIDVRILGKGSTNAILCITSDKLTDSLKKIIETNSFNDSPIYRLKQSKIKDYPKSIAIKIQMFYTSNKYWEARAMREEFILNKINDIADNVKAPSFQIKQHTPRYYLGFTVNFPSKKMNVKIRLTFMEVIDIKKYRTIYSLISDGYKFSEEIAININTLVKSLWRFGISHNDLSLNNILVNLANNDIKLIDFGLAELITTESIDSEEQYEQYYASIDKNSLIRSIITNLHTN